ncbi:MAG: AAA family ATPase [Patescibacteria group bacterium]
MLKRLEIAGFKSFARKTVLDFASATTSIVGPNGSGKSNVAEAFRFALGEQSMKSMRGKRSEDLIWAGSHTNPRANRAAVAIVFDNSKRIFPKLDFDEVSVERAVFRDGASEYSINGSKVRLRDVQELLAAANIGDTGHHIISQGEADRILLAHPRERRAMLEDALGLKVFEFKKQEAERKLEKTEENVREVESLRREIAPHIRFLQKQVEKLERAEAFARELAELARTYFATEEAYIDREKKEAEGRKRVAEERLATSSAELAAFDERATTDSEGMKRSEAIRQAEKDVDRVVQQRGELARELGRVEGGLAEAKKRSVQVAREPYVKVPREDLAALRTEIDKQTDLADASPDALRAALGAIRGMITAFFERFASPQDDYLAEEEQTVMRLEGERETLLEKDQALATEIEKARSGLMKAREAALAYEETGREEKRRILGLAESKAHEEGQVEREAARLRELAYLAEELERDRAEVLALAGAAAFSYEPLTELPQEDRRQQEDRKRQLERLKIRLEEAGGTSDDIRKEYEDATSREAFLARELEDLAKSAEGLKALIADLDTELQKTFAEGLAKVNASFGEFFGLMFGGGAARLVLEEQPDLRRGVEGDDEEYEEEGGVKQWKPGIEISVALPRKKVQSLMQLSGGERALTSIALIFAMSQVNPPPFLILDETDAALDEANSRRYGDLIEQLAKKSQLIVITHNRETMSRAGILYGVTMGNDGISKLLSVKFEEAALVAK